MALDISLFTLTFQRRSDDPTILDLLPFHPAAMSASSSKQPLPLYSFSRAQTSHYDIQLVDHLTNIPLSSITSSSSSDKIRKIQLYNPDDSIIFEKKNMTFRQEWRWTWQDQEYLIRKDGGAYIVEAIRKPDPEIDVARYNPASKTRPGFLQILDYNIQRLEVNDRRGLEVLVLTAILTLLDIEYDEKFKDGQGGNMYMTGAGPTLKSSSSSSSQGGTLPTHLPPSSQPQQLSGEANEIPIDMHTSIEIYVQHAIRLMRQDNGGEGLHLIILKALSPEVTPKAVRIAAEIKARWYRLEAVAKGRTLDPLPGSASEIAEELYQYVRDPSLQKKQPLSGPGGGAAAATPVKDTSTGSGPRPRIKLDAPSTPAGRSPSPTPGHGSPGNNKNNKSFAPPPAQLDIYLSKERIDEFEVGLPAGARASGASRHHHPSTPDRTPIRTPVIPPKGNPHGKHESHPSDGSSSGGAKKILGKLGLRKNNGSET